MSETPVENSAVDAGQVLSECFPVLEGIWEWAAAIQPGPRAEESCVGVNHQNMAVGQLLIGKSHPAALY